MAPDSRIIVDEMVIPDKGAHSYATIMDLAMMIMFGSLERTKEEFVEIFQRAGLILNRDFLYNPNQADTVMELVQAPN